MKRVVIVDTQTQSVKQFHEKTTELYAKDVQTDARISVRVRDVPVLNFLGLVSKDNRLLHNFGPVESLDSWRKLVNELECQVQINCEYSVDVLATHFGLMTVPDLSKEYLARCLDGKFKFNMQAFYKFIDKQNLHDLAMKVKAELE